MVRNGTLLIVCALALLLLSGCAGDDNDTCPIDYLATVNLLADDDFAAGQHVVVWPLEDQYGEIVVPGTYMAHMCSEGNVSTIQIQVMPRSVIEWMKPTVDTKQKISSGIAPNGMYLVTYGGTFYPGDTIAFSFDLPAAAHVRIGITGLN